MVNMISRRVLRLLAVSQHTAIAAWRHLGEQKIVAPLCRSGFEYSTGFEYNTGFGISRTLLCSPLLKETLQEHTLLE